MFLRDWLHRRWPKGDVPVEVYISVGSSLARSLAEAWNYGNGLVHGSLTLDDIEIDEDRTLRVIGLSISGDRVAHQSDLQKAGELLYALVTGVDALDEEPGTSDRVAAILSAIQTSSFRVERDRVQAEYPVIGRVIAQMLSTRAELGFSDGWAVAEAFDLLVVDPSAVVIQAAVPPPLSVDGTPADETLFVELFRSGDQRMRAAPVGLAMAMAPEVPAVVPPVLVPARPRWTPPPIERPAAALHKRAMRGWLPVAMCVVSVWGLGLAMGCAALWQQYRAGVDAPDPVPKHAPIEVTAMADLDWDTGAFDVEGDGELAPMVSIPKEVSQTRPPNPSSGRLHISLVDTGMAQALEVNCPGGFRERRSAQSGQVHFQNVPSEACILYFKGPMPARYQSVRGGMSLQCSLSGSTAVCSS